MPELVAWIQQFNGPRTIVLEQREQAQSPWIPVNTYGDSVIRRLDLFDPDRSVRNGFVVAWPCLTIQATSMR